MKGIKRLLVLQHLEIEGPGLFKQFAEERDLKVEIIRLDKKDNLPKTKEGDLILIMGGPMGVKDIGSDRYSWLKLERDFIRRELDNKRPIIGVCLGAQLIASAAGGDVEILKYGYPPKELPEIGWSQIFIDKSNSDFKAMFEDPFYVLHWHGDRILLPNKALLIASLCLLCLRKILSKPSSLIIFNASSKAKTKLTAGVYGLLLLKRLFL